MNAATKKPRRAGDSHGASRAHRNDFDFGSKPTASSPRLPASHRLPANWRARLRSGAEFFRAHVPELSATDSTGHATGRCPLCADRSGTFRVQMTNHRGPWSCDACGHGDAIAFAMRLLGVAFAEAVRRLIEVQK